MVLKKRTPIPSDGRRPHSERAAEPLADSSYLAYLRNTPRPFMRFVSGHFPPATVTHLHGHPCIALHGCLQGPLSLVTPDAELPLDAGVFYLLGPGVKHFWRNTGRQTAATFGLLIDAEHPGRWPAGAGVDDCCRKLVRHVKGIHKFNTAGDDELRHLYWMCADHLTSLEPRGAAIVTGALLALLGQCVARLAGSSETVGSSDNVAQQVRRLLLSKVNDRLSINDIARQIGVSPTRAKEAFRNAFNSGIIAYHNQLKIWQAKRLLGDLSLNIEEVSNRLGFSTHSYFSQVFLQLTGESPSEFRRRNADPHRP